MESEHAMALTRHPSRATFQRYAKRARAAERAFYEVMGEEP
ncbi:hypothetical protein [Leptolyngbya sp. FACHB-261]|nr:hypothetical protein [Leptolyngbya sp. FACHB-261]